MRNNLHVFLGATVADAAARPLHWVYNQKKLKSYIKVKKDFSFLKKNKSIKCIVGLTVEPERLIEIRKTRMNTLNESRGKNYTDLKKINEEVEMSKKTFQKYKWPVIDVTRKSVEETAASIIKMYEIKKKNA